MQKSNKYKVRCKADVTNIERNVNPMIKLDALFKLKLKLNFK